MTVMAWWSNTGKIEVNLDSVRLEPGSHGSPRDGVCIMELASVIAEEPFSDHPRCACKVIAAFLRAWNDRASHSARQRLLPYAKRVVGSRAGRRVTRRRRDVCLTWAGADLTGNWLSRAMRRLAMRVRIFVLGIGPALRLNEGAGQLAARAVFARYDAETGLKLVDNLLAIGSERRPTARPRAPGATATRSARAIAEAPCASRCRFPPAQPATETARNGSGSSAGLPSACRPTSREPTALAGAIPRAAKGRVSASVRQLARHPHAADPEQDREPGDDGGDPATCPGETCDRVTKNTYMTMAPIVTIHSGTRASPECSWPGQVSS